MSVELTAARLRQLLAYDPETGEFTRLRRTASNAPRGAIAGTRHKQGYIIIRVDGRGYKAHRLAWLYVTGELPPHEIDHINWVRDDNRWTNLRLATHAQNMANVPRRRDNKLGLKGIRQMRGRWQVRIGNGGRHHVGTFDSLEEAKQAYATAARSIYGEYAP